MADSSALITGLIGLGGVALGLAGNAAIEWVRRTAARRDAAKERQAAVLRELLDILDEYSREWGEVAYAVDRGEASLAELSLTSNVAVIGGRFRTLVEMITDDQLREDVGKYSDEVFDRGAGSKKALPLPGLWNRMNDVKSHIGDVLRHLNE